MGSFLSAASERIARRQVSPLLPPLLFCPSLPRFFCLRTSSRLSTFGTRLLRLARLIQLVEKGQAALRVSAGGTGLKAGFGIELRQRHACPFINQLVETRSMALGKAAKPLVLG